MTREAVARALHPTAAGAGCSVLKRLGVAAVTMAEEDRRWSHGVVVYRWKKEVRFFHMLTHHAVADEVCPAGPTRLVWAEPKLSSEQAHLIASRCRMMASVHKEDPGAFPYGFRFAASIVASDGRLRLGPGESGVTCSTIIAAAFADEGCALVDMTDWPPADRDDIAARRAFLDSLRNPRKPAPKTPQPPVDAAVTAAREARAAEAKARADLLEAEIETPRVRPQDVVAAAALYPPAKRFEELVEGAGAVESRIDLYGVAPAPALTPPRR